MKIEFVKKFHTILLVIACIVFAIGLNKTMEYNDALRHDPEDIKIEITNVKSGSDDRKYYVYLDYNLINDSGETLYLVKVTTYFHDNNGDLIYTLRTDLGSTWEVNALNLAPTQSITEERSLSEYQSANSYDDMFVELYNNGLDNAGKTYEITHEITYVQWADDYYYSK